MRFEIDVDGVLRNHKRIESLGERMLDLRPAGDRVLDELADAERRHFNSVPWAPLAKSTRKRKQRQGTHGRTMRESGLLERTMTGRGAVARRHGQLNRRGRSSVLFGIKRGRVDIFYARFHQKGKGVPKRIIVPNPTAMTSVRIARVLLDHITEDAR
ncbi:MAG TPA: hypothetical protein VK631_07420 [Solirubrobacteraceae bacterium]|nr:hypothetical protein [Solirubrobacteraceae bacterium]